MLLSVRLLELVQPWCFHGFSSLTPLEMIKALKHSTEHYNVALQTSIVCNCRCRAHSRACMHAQSQKLSQLSATAADMQADSQCAMPLLLQGESLSMHTASLCFTGVPKSPEPETRYVS